MAALSNCCAPKAQAVCCEPIDKPSCCGKTSAAATQFLPACGCTAGRTDPRGVK